VTNTFAERKAAHVGAVHLVDTVAVRRALLGSPVALTELERGAVISICDLGQIDRNLVAQGLGLSKAALNTALRQRQRHLPAAEADTLVAAMAERVPGLVAAVGERDRAAVSRLMPVQVEELQALVIAFADLAGTAGGDVDD
jgi:hypothetical protein